VSQKIQDKISFLANLTAFSSMISEFPKLKIFDKNETVLKPPVYSANIRLLI